MHIERLNSPAVPNLAIFIMRTSDGTHTGIIHRMGENLMIQDLQWHEAFRSQRCSRLPAFVSFSLEQEVEDRVRGLCRLIHNRHNSRDRTDKYRIPYAFRHGNNNRFNSATGELMLVDGLGLTCSMFVLTVFQTAGVPLVDFDGWQRRDDDDARHNALLEKMRTGFTEYNIPRASHEHVERVRAELPCIRVRPEEVAAAGLFDDLPASFAQLATAGEWILAQIPPVESR